MLLVLRPSRKHRLPIQHVQQLMSFFDTHQPKIPRPCTSTKIAIRPYRTVHSAPSTAKVAAGFFSIALVAPGLFALAVHTSEGQARGELGSRRGAEEGIPATSRSRPKTKPIPFGKKVALQDTRREISWDKDDNDVLSVPDETNPKSSPRAQRRPPGKKFVVPVRTQGRKEDDVTAAFVDGLVLAGYCKEHKPRRKELRDIFRDQARGSPLFARKMSPDVTHAVGYQQRRYKSATAKRLARIVEGTSTGEELSQYYDPYGGSIFYGQQDHAHSVPAIPAWGIYNGKTTRDAQQPLFASKQQIREPDVPASHPRSRHDSGVHLDIVDDLGAAEYEPFGVPEVHLDVLTTTDRPTEPPDGEWLLEPSRQQEILLVPPSEDDMLKQNLEELITLLQPGASWDKDAVWTLYQAISKADAPGVSYLENDQLRRLMSYFSTVQYHGLSSNSERYLHLVMDMRRANKAMTAKEWTAAINAAARSKRTMGDDDFQAGLQMWEDMTGEGVQNDEVTFNVFFEIAFRSGRYALAEQILHEMEQRGMQINRHIRTSKIYFYGARGDGEGIRRAFKEFIDAGEIVDTTTLNCLMAAYINAGQPQAAEHVFVRMKEIHYQVTRLASRGSDSKAAKRSIQRPSPSTQWRETRKLARALNEAAIALRSAPDIERQELLEASIPRGPDPQSFRILLRAACHTSGDYRRVESLVEEMLLVWHYPADGSIFVTLLKGFAKYGGVKYEPYWTNRQLDELWNALLQGIDQGVVRIEAGMVTAALDAWSTAWRTESWEPSTSFPTSESSLAASKHDAFGPIDDTAQSSASDARAERLWQVWESLRSRWKDPDQDEVARATKVLGWLVPDLGLDTARKGPKVDGREINRERHREVWEDDRRRPFEQLGKTFGA